MSEFLDVINIIFSSPYGAFVSGLCGVLLGHRLNIGRDKRKEIAIAKQKFKAAFLPEYTSLRGPGDPGDIYAILQNAFERHQKAIYEFVVFIPFYRQQKFMKTWENYCCCKNKRGDVSTYLEQYATDGHSYAYTKEIKDTAIKRIDALLKYSKP